MNNQDIKLVIKRLDSSKNMANSVKSENTLSDGIRSVLAESCSASFLGRLLDFSVELERVEREHILDGLASPSVHELLSQFIDRGVVEEFTDREHSQFTREDFKEAPEKSEQILQCLNILLKHAQDCSLNEEVTSTIKKLCPKLVYFLSGNIPKNLWTSPDSIKIAKQVLQKLKRFFNVDTCSDLVHVNVSSNSSDLPSPSTSLYGKYHAMTRGKLTKETWQRNPFAKASFTWLLLHVKFPHLSDYLSLVLPLPLNMVDDFNIENKILGVQCLYHIMENVSQEELRWYGRAEVVYEALKHQLYTKHAALVEVLHPALLSVLNIVEKPQSVKDSRDVNRCDEVFKMIVFDSEMENNMAVRRALTASLPAFIDMMGITVVRHMKSVITVVSNYLEIYDGPEEIARINALKTLKTLLLTAWPRAPAHAVCVMKCLLKFLYDLGADKTTTPQDVKDEMTGLATGCLVLLKMAAPDIVEPALMGIAETDTLDFVKDVVQDVYARKA